MEVLEGPRLSAMGIRVNFVRPIVFKGKKIWPIGSRLYPTPPNFTFHDFITKVLYDQFGADWWKAQEGADPQHYVKECFDAFSAFKVRNAIPENRTPGGAWSSDTDGYTKYLISLAFDMVSLIHAHTSNLPPEILRRLKNRDQFQGARYELGIAAIFARLGYKIEFHDDDPELKDKIHCDFTVRHPTTRDVVAVETKSRHRAGVLNQDGEFDAELVGRGDVDRLIRAANQQNPGDKPFIIFVDLNMPISVDRRSVEDGWFSDLRTRLGRMTADDVSGANAIYVTNFSYHFQGDQPSLNNEFSEHIVEESVYSIEDPHLYRDLALALGHYGQVPGFDVDGVLGWGDGDDQVS